MFTELSDRLVWHDGDITVLNGSIGSLLTAGVIPSRVKVTELTPEIVKYNKFVAKTDRITIKTGIQPLDFTWNLPESYMTMDITHYLIDKLSASAVPKAEHSSRIKRIFDELQVFTDLDLLMPLRASIYIVETFNANNIVWGVGRGSSVSSYILYVIGIHDIDSFKYNLDLADFVS